MGKNAKEIKVISTAKPKKNPYKNDIISDDMGQWKYPGQPTRIHSGDITMNGVPYPVLGVDNLGNQELMLPGMDYTFPGQYVDEFPMARNGGTPKSLKKYTNKNIKSSINYLMRRNETLFGPSGKKFYRPMQDGGAQTPEEWENEIRAVEGSIGNPSTWTLESHKMLQDKLNAYKAWRENTTEGKAVVDYHNEPNEYVIPLPSHLQAANKGELNPYEKEAIAKVIMNRNKDKDFVQRAYAVGDYPDSKMFTKPDDNNFGERNSHLMGWGDDDQGQAYMYPSIFNDEKEAIKVPNQYADYMSDEGYKKATGMIKKNGGATGWLDEYGDGGSKKKEPKPPVEEQRIVKYTDKGLYDKAARAEADSMDLHVINERINQYKLKHLKEGVALTTKEKVEKLKEEWKNKPFYNFAEHVKKEDEKNKVTKPIKEYVYDYNNDVNGLAKLDTDTWKKNYKPIKGTEKSKETVQKDGKIKRTYYDKEGNKQLTYHIVDPISGTVRAYHGDKKREDDLFAVVNPNIHSASTDYYSYPELKKNKAFDIKNMGVMNYYENNKLVKTEKLGDKLSEYENYNTGSTEILHWKKPVIHNVYEEPPIPSQKSEPTKQVIQQDTTNTQAPVIPTIPVATSPTPVTPIGVHYRTYLEGLAAVKAKAGKKGPETPYPLHGVNYTSKPVDKKKNGGWLDEYQPGGQKVYKDPMQAWMEGKGRPTQAEAMQTEVNKRLNANAKHATISPDYRTEKQKDASARALQYIEDPSAMDYFNQIGYMPSLALSNPFNMGEKLKEIRRINSDETLSGAERFKQLMSIGLDAGINGVTNALTEGLTEGLLPGAINKVQDLTTKSLTKVNKANIKKLADAPVFPGFRQPNLPETLSHQVRPMGDSYVIILKDPKGNKYGHLSLSPETKYMKDAEGEYIRDAAGKVAKEKPVWAKPDMISVAPRLQGNKTQDLLYQLGIEEANKRGMKGVRSGDVLLSPAKTKKAHERFNREILGSSKYWDDVNKSVFDVDISGLTGHTNPSVIEDWYKNYALIDKLGKRNMYSLNDVGSTLKKGYKQIAPGVKKVGSLAGVAAGILGGMEYGPEMFDAMKSMYGFDSDSSNFVPKSSPQTYQDGLNMVKAKGLNTTKSKKTLAQQKKGGNWLDDYEKGGALPHVDQPYLPEELSSGVDPRTGRKFVYNPYVADFNDLNSTPWKNPRVEQPVSVKEPVAAPVDFHPDMVNLLPSESTMVSMDVPDESSIAAFKQNKKIAAVKKPQAVTKPVVTKVVAPTKTTLKQDVDLNTFNSPETYDIVVNRQKEDYKKYHRFTQQGSDIMNRTDMGRNKDSEKYIQDLLSNRKDNSVIIDIGSALGNKDSKLAGVSVKELYDNPVINQKAHIIATDIPSEMKVWNAKKDKYAIDVAEVSDKTFNTDVQGILNTKKLNADHVILRAANSIDLIMDANQTVEHFKHLGNTLKDKEVTYVYNNAILYKPKGSTKFAVKAKLNNAAFDHKSADGKNWVTDKNRKSYTNLSSEKEFYKQKGGQVNWLDEFR